MDEKPVLIALSDELNRLKIGYLCCNAKELHVWIKYHEPLHLFFYFSSGKFAKRNFTFELDHCFAFIIIKVKPPSDQKDV